ncbi:MAG: LptF/LptG family permease [Cytophagales bacterium]
MMFKLTILDRYILKKYLVTFVFVVLIIITVICVIDYTEKNEDFLTKNVPLREIFISYYLNFIPYVINILSPILVFIATVFVTARLASRTEIIAILSSGTSFLRILRPYLLGSAIIAIVTYYMYGWVIPRASRIRHGFENVYVRGQYFFDKRNVHIKVAPTSYVYMESYNNSIHCGYQFTIETIDIGRVIDKLSASRIVWKEDIKKWRIEYWTKHSFEGKKEIETRGNELDTTLNLSPKDFETQHMLYEQMTIDELSAQVDLLTQRGAEGVEPYLIEKYTRQTYPFSIIILTIIGVIVSSRKSREGVGLQIALGFGLAFMYIIFMIIGQSIGKGGAITPALSAWIPNVIFSGIGLIMYFRVPK